MDYSTIYSSNHYYNNFHPEFQSILSFPDWKLVIDQKGIYSMDKVGEFRVEWMYIEKLSLFTGKVRCLAWKL